MPRSRKKFSPRCAFSLASADDMNITFLGGGNEIGASSAIVEIGAARILIDCGVRMSGEHRLPDLAAIKQTHAGQLNAVLLTHAHMDHNGDRMHSPRELEEQRLVETVAGVIEQKGKLLIPAFAIGRAQEVALMLLKQFRSKKLASFPVWIDGMVKTVCGVYSQYPAHQTPYARRLIEKHGNPFFNIVDEIRQVASPAEREKVLSGDPCVIIASSGMLTGGASAFYAQHLVNDERNSIAITGYQDEESPGRQLLALAEAETREVTVAGKTLEVKLGVKLDASLDDSTANAAMTAFHERTGWRLRLQTPQATIAKQPAAETTASEASPQTSPPRIIEQSKLEFCLATSGHPLSEKAATAEIEEAFSLAPETWRPSRVKLKTDEAGDYLELAFLTPELGLRQNRTMRVMARQNRHAAIAGRIGRSLPAVRRDDRLSFGSNRVRRNGRRSKRAQAADFVLREEEKNKP